MYIQPIFVLPKDNCWTKLYGAYNRPGGVNVAGLDNVIAIASAFDFQPQFSMEFTVNRKHHHLAVTFSQTVPMNTDISSFQRNKDASCKM